MNLECKNPACGQTIRMMCRKGTDYCSEVCEKAVEQNEEDES